MNWTKKDIENLSLKNNYENRVKANIDLASKLNQRGKISVEKETIKKVLWVLNREKVIPDYVEELEFHPERKFRFDWAIPDLKVAVEYEGIISKKSRHTTITGFTEDCIKYNEAQKLGWIVLRYTALNYQNLTQDLKNIIKN